MDGIITQTTLAHRMLLKAWQIGGQASQQAFLTVLFKGYFENLANIGDTEVLANMAVDAKLMSKEEVSLVTILLWDAPEDLTNSSQAVSFLESAECLDEVERMMNEARKKGVNGVPFVVIDGKWAVSGGQTAEVYAQVRDFDDSSANRAYRANLLGQILKKLANSEPTTPRPTHAAPPRRERPAQGVSFACPAASLPTISPTILFVAPRSLIIGWSGQSVFPSSCCMVLFSWSSFYLLSVVLYPPSFSAIAFRFLPLFLSARTYRDHTYTFMTQRADHGFPLPHSILVNLLQRYLLLCVCAVRRSMPADPMMNRVWRVLSAAKVPRSL